MILEQQGINLFWCGRSD